MFPCRRLFSIQLVLLFFVLFSCNNGDDEPVVLWEKVYGGDELDSGRSVRLTSDGGFIIGGFTCSFGAGSYDVYLIKTDSQGDTLWTRTFGGSSYDYGVSVVSTSDNGYVVVGVVSSFGEGLGDVYLIKTDESGNTIFEKNYGGKYTDMGYCVQQTSDGGLIIVGSTTLSSNGMSDVYLLRTDINGDTLWTRMIGGTDSEEGYSVQQTTDGGFIIVGVVSSETGGDVLAIRTDADGDTIWTATYGGESYDRGKSVQQTHEGTFVITGGTESYGAIGKDVLLMKIDDDGRLIWLRTFGGSGHDYGEEMQVTHDGGCVIVGYTRSGESGGREGDVFLIKTDANGDEQWSATFGGDRFDAGHSVQGFSNGYIITGTTQSFRKYRNDDLYLLKVYLDDE